MLRRKGRGSRQVHFFHSAPQGTGIYSQPGCRPERTINPPSGLFKHVQNVATLGIIECDGTFNGRHLSG